MLAKGFVHMLLLGVTNCSAGCCQQCMVFRLHATVVSHIMWSCCTVAGMTVQFVSLGTNACRQSGTHKSGLLGLISVVTAAWLVFPVRQASWQHIQKSPAQELLCGLQLLFTTQLCCGMKCCQ